MCGFVGIVSQNEIEKENLIKMRDSILHRGPDSSGVFISPNNRIGMGFRRLSIIDLSEAGSQPMTEQANNLTIVFNGEVYNYKLIREELLSLGYRFKSHSDSEVVLYAFKHWGINSLEKFQGMFAFAIWNEAEKSMFIARDRLGIKPLYYSLQNQEFCFGSEIKTILNNKNFSRELNKDALNDYLAYGYIPHNKAIFRDISKLPAGHFLIYKNNELTVKRYWELEYKPEAMTEDEAVYNIQNRLENAVKLWSISDVPVGIFLSGGIDSSAMCGLASKQISHSQQVTTDSSKDIGAAKDNLVQTFSIGFDYQKNNELEFAKVIAEKFGTLHRQEIVNVSHAATLLETIANIYDEPFVDSSSVPTFYLCQIATKHVKVALAGDGGDELFFGYHRYNNFINLQNQRHSLKSKLLNISSGLGFMPFASRLKYNDKYSSSAMQAYFRLVGFFDNEERKKIVGTEYKQNHDHLWLFNKFYDKHLPQTTSLRLLDINTYLVDDILTKVDRASMAASLEARTPMLEHTFMEFVMSIPDEHIYKNSDKKYLLKKSLSQLLPANTISRGKQGFGAPIRHWLMNDLQKEIENKIYNGYAVQDGIFSASGIKSMMRNMSENRWAKLWMLLVFEMWYRKWIKDIHN